MFMCIGTAAGVLSVFRLLSNKKEKALRLDDGNPYLDHDRTEAAEKVPVKHTIYTEYIKNFLGTVVSFFALLALSPVFLAVSIAVYIDDPGPVLFKQKRVGKGKSFFMLHKYRSMKISTPHDVPTAQLDNPDQYITRVGRFLRKSSLDELPQIWDIFRGKMCIVGPRPALWNQDDLVAERDKYGANDIKPGLTGWAQINGRDKLTIPQKAKLDGEYVKLRSFLFDCRCFVKTIISVLKSDGVVEGKKNV